MFRLRPGRRTNAKFRPGRLLDNGRHHQACMCWFCHQAKEIESLRRRPLMMSFSRDDPAVGGGVTMRRRQEMKSGNARVPSSGIP
jgi:hypothetical protein